MGEANHGLAVGEVAALAGTTVRTLHHYDRIGLLRPSERGPSGQRRYHRADLERLQRILFYRELEFDLERIGALLDGDTEPLEHLRRQRALLLDRRARIDELISTLEQTMEANRAGIDLTPAEMLEVFDGFDPSEHAAEAEERWGHTDAWAQSRARTARFTKDDWTRVADGAKAFNRLLADTMAAGEPSDGETAMDLAEQARVQIDQTFYDCPHEMHRALATMYLEDPRFTATYEEVAPGLARWWHDAIHANADRHGTATDEHLSRG